MATLRQIIEALDTYLETAGALGITCVKGFPDFRQPNLVPPVAALFYAGSSAARPETARGRVGSSSPAVTLTLGVYATDEVNLLELAEKLQAIRKARPVISAGTGSAAQKLHLVIGDDERTPPDAEDPKELRHFITVPVSLVTVKSFT